MSVDGCGELVVDRPCQWNRLRSRDLWYARCGMGKNLDIDAVVRNRSSYRYGIQFVDLDELQREQIRTIAVRILAYTSGE